MLGINVLRIMLDELRFTWTKIIQQTHRYFCILWCMILVYERQKNGVLMKTSKNRLYSYVGYSYDKTSSYTRFALQFALVVIYVHLHKHASFLCSLVTQHLNLI